MNRIAQVVAFILIAIFAMSSYASDTAEHSFRMKIYVFEGSQDAGVYPDNIPNLVQRALTEVEKFRDYKSFRLIDELVYLVRADQDINRFIDIPERLWTLSHDAQVSFTMIYDQSEKFLTLSDFRFMINQIPKIRNSVSVRPDNAVVIGSTQKHGNFDNMFFVLTLEVSDKLFPGQSAAWRFKLFNAQKPPEN